MSDCCPPANPCTCLGTSTPAVVSCPPATDCLILCDIVILAQDGVGPCGEAGLIDVSDDATYGHDFSICDSDPEWSLVSIDGTLDSASVTLAGVLTWVTGDGDSAGTYSTVTLRARCGEYSALMSVVIGTKDLCATITCSNCEYCDPCTGECEDHEAKTVEITSNTEGLVNGLTINVDEVISYTSTICSGLLPADLVVNYNVSECGVITSKSQTIAIACPTGCSECSSSLTPGTSDPCPDDDCTETCPTGNAIPVNKCFGVTCPEGETCNPSTGECS